MSFSRPFLKSIGLTDDQINAAMEEHTAVTNALKQQRDQAEENANKYKADAEKLADTQKELDALKARKDYKDDFDRVSKEYSDYKAQVSAEAEAKEVRAAYKQLLADSSIDEKYHDAILKATDFSAMKRDKEGKLEGADKLKESIAKDWGAFKVTKWQRGLQVDTPPKSDNDGSGSEIRNMTAKWHAERYGTTQNNTGKDDNG